MEEDNFILAAAGIQPQSMADMQGWQCPPPDPLFHPNGWGAFTAVCNDVDLIRELGGFGGDPGSSCLSIPLGSTPNLGLKSNQAEFVADPGFVEQVAKFSCFGSRGFNRGQFAADGDAKLGRVSSSHSLNGSGLAPRQGVEIGRSLWPLEGINSMESPEEESSVIEPVQSAEMGTRGSGGTNPRKRKAAANGGKAIAVTGTKRCKSDEETGEKKGKDEGKQPEEAPKDYIHVRARRGQATDSHSLAERVRREKISERMKLLQDLVPGCNKVTGKAVMLDEIINYVQSLQRQVEFLSMKLASFNTTLDSPLSKDHHHHMYSSPHHHRHQMYDGEAHPPPRSSSSDLQGLHHDRQLHPHLALPSDLQVKGGGGGGGGGGDDYYLQTIVEMGMGQRSLQDTSATSSFHPQFFHY